MKLRIAKTGTTTRTRVDDAAPTVAAGKHVPSPSLDSMIDHVAHPEKHTHDLVRHETELGQRTPSTAPVPTAPPAPPDLGDAVTRSRGGK